MRELTASGWERIDAVRYQARWREALDGRLAFLADGFFVHGNVLKRTEQRTVTRGNLSRPLVEKLAEMICASPQPFLAMDLLSESNSEDSANEQCDRIRRAIDPGNKHHWWYVKSARGTRTRGRLYRFDPDAAIHYCHYCVLLRPEPVASKAKPQLSIRLEDLRVASTVFQGLGLLLELRVELKNVSEKQLMTVRRFQWEVNGREFGTTFSHRRDYFPYLPCQIDAGRLVRGWVVVRCPAPQVRSAPSVQVRLRVEIDDGEPMTANAEFQLPA